MATVFGARRETAPSVYEHGILWIPGTGNNTGYRLAQGDAQAMAIPEGTVVDINRGLHFIE
jgi:hypothetical protein